LAEAVVEGVLEADMFSYESIVAAVGLVSFMGQKTEMVRKVFMRGL